MDLVENGVFSRGDGGAACFSRQQCIGFGGHGRSGKQAEQSRVQTGSQALVPLRLVRRLSVQPAGENGIQVVSAEKANFNNN